MKKFWFCFILCIIFAIGTVAFAEGLDLAAPKGMISLSTGTVVAGVYHVNTSSVTLQISASDNITAAEDLMMIISDKELSGDYLIDDNNWESYKTEYEYTLPSLEEVNYVYLYLKDEVGNISPSILTGVSNSYTVSFDAGSGDNAPSSRNVDVGMHFIVPSQTPSYDGHYFLGWSFVKGGAVQCEPYSVLTSKYIKGDITLYAVWTEGVVDLPKLSEKVGIGDYVNYPVPYENVQTGNGESVLSGWRVLSIEEDASGNEYVNIVSAGVPLSYYHSTSSSDSVKNLTTNLTNIPVSTSGDSFRENGFISDDLNVVFNNRFTQKYTTSETSSYTDSVIGQVSTTRNKGEFKIRSITKEDVDKVFDKTGTNKIANNTDLTEIKYGKLLAVTTETDDNYAKYFIASANSASALWNVSGDGAVSNSNNEESGIRLVVSLKSSVRTNYEATDGVWDVLDEGLQVGEYVTYKGTGTATVAKGISGTSADQTINASTYENVMWRVISVEGGKVNIIPVNPLGSLSLSGHVGEANAINALDTFCKAFINSNLGVSSGDIRSLTVDDVNTLARYTPSYTTRSAYYPNGTSVSGTITVDGKTYTKRAHNNTTYKFIKGLDGVDGGGEEYVGTDGITYLKPTADNPVLCTQTYYSYNPSSYTISGTSKTVGSLFSGDKGWLASPCVVLSDTHAYFLVRVVSSSSVYYCNLAGSNGITYSGSFGVLPLVSLSSQLLTIGTGEGTSDSPYSISLRGHN